MDRVDVLLRQLHSGETTLATTFRAVSNRDATDHEVRYSCLDLAKQCLDHRGAIERLGRERGHTVPSHHLGNALRTVTDRLLRQGSLLLGRHPAAGLVLLQDLRHLFVTAQKVNILWIAAGQVAQATRDPQMLTTITGLHEQTLTQIKWVKTKLRQITPQVLLTG